MGCNDIQERLSAYIEGLTSTEEKAMIEEHLKSCKECKETFEDLEKTISYVKTLEDIEPPAWLSQKIMTRVRERADKKEGILHKLFYPLHIKLPVQAIATILIAVSAFYIFKTIQSDIRLSESLREEITVPQTLRRDKDELTKVSEIDESFPLKGETHVPVVTGDSIGEASKPEPTASMKQMYHAKELESSDRYEETPEAETRVEMQKNLKVESKVRGRLFEARKKEQYVDITLIVDNIENTQKDIEKIVAYFKGKMSAIEIFKDRRILTVVYDTSKTDELLAQLRLIGEIKKEEFVLEEREGYGEIRIEIRK